MTRRWLIRVLVLVGAILTGSAAEHLVWESSSATPLHQVIVALLVGESGLGLLYGGYLRTSRTVATDPDLRILVWMAGSGIMFASLGVVSLYIASQRVATRVIGTAVRLNGSVGLVIGILTGTIQAQAIRNAEAAAQTEALEAERQRLEELNDVLRQIYATA